MCECVNVAMGSYANQVILRLPEHMQGGRHTHVGIDRCIAREVVALWRRGITTTGCCCGHNKVPGYIGVAEQDIPRMKALGYHVHPNPCRPGDEDSFSPQGGPLPMISIHHYRRAYFAMCRALGLDGDARHDYNEALTGHRSTTEFDEADWRTMTSELQALTGRPGVIPGQPHLRHDVPDGLPELPYPLDEAATPRQVAAIHALRDRIAWRHEDGPDAGLIGFVSMECLWGKLETERQQWIEHSRDPRLLPRAVASIAIYVLAREARFAPAQPMEAASRS